MKNNINAKCFWVTLSVLFLIGIFFRGNLLFGQDNGAFPKQELGVIPCIFEPKITLNEEQLAQGWIALFDGVSLFGWKVLEGEATVSNGKMVSATSSPAVVATTNSFRNFQLHYNGKRMAVQGRTEATPIELVIDQEGISTITLVPLDSKPIFDGIVKSKLIGWKVYPQSQLTIEEGVFHLVGGSGALEWLEPVGNFVLQFEYFTPSQEKGVNSGVFFRCIPGEKMNGYECQLFNNPPENDYKSFLGTNTGGIFRRQVGRRLALEDDRWHHVTVLAFGAHFATWVNGVQVTDWTDTRDSNANPRNGLRLEPGTIQFQGHDPQTDIRFRNIRLESWD